MREIPDRKSALRLSPFEKKPQKDKFNPKIKKILSEKGFSKKYFSELRREETEARSTLKQKGVLQPDARQVHAEVMRQRNAKTRQASLALLRHTATARLKRKTGQEPTKQQVDAEIATMLTTLSKFPTKFPKKK